MNAYSLVDNQVRKKLNEMLETWKAPVPGSIEKRPVFPPEVTRPIENALIKARTVAVQLQQQQARSQQEMLNRGRPTSTPSGLWRNTPTPPQNNTRYPAPSAQQSYPQHQISNGHPQVCFSTRTCILKLINSLRLISHMLHILSLQRHHSLLHLHISSVHSSHKFILVNYHHTTLSKLYTKT